MSLFSNCRVKSLKSSIFIDPLLYIFFESIYGKVMVKVDLKKMLKRLLPYRCLK